MTVSPNLSMYSALVGASEPCLEKKEPIGRELFNLTHLLAYFWGLFIIIWSFELKRLLPSFTHYSLQACLL